MWKLYIFDRKLSLVLNCHRAKKPANLILKVEAVFNRLVVESVIIAKEFPSWQPHRGTQRVSTPMILMFVLWNYQTSPSTLKRRVYTSFRVFLPTIRNPSLKWRLEKSQNSLYIREASLFSLPRRARKQSMASRCAWLIKPQCNLSQVLSLYSLCNLQHQILSSADAHRFTRANVNHELIR